jgi:ligand-binding sensor domain-containing protein
MVGNEVSAIEFDALGNTWIGTNNGLVVYNPKGVVFSKPEAPPKPASLRLFPNPVADDLVVEYDAQFTGTAQLRLSTLSGQQLHSWSWQLTETGTQRYPLSLAGIPAGMYVLVLETEQTSSYQKLVVQ